jgi:NADPH2:quinone reductase
MPPDPMQMTVKALKLIGFGGPWSRSGRAEAARAEISGHLRNGDPRPVIGRSFPLVEAAEAHRAVEGRATTGKAVLVV